MNFYLRRANWSGGRLLLIMGWLLSWSLAAGAPALTFSVSAVDEEELRATESARFQLHVMNSTAQTVSWRFPAALEARLTTSNATVMTKLHRVAPAAAETIALAPGTFARDEYQLTMPGTTIGAVSIEIFGMNMPRLLVPVAPPGERIGGAV